MEKEIDNIEERKSLGNNLPIWLFKNMNILKILHELKISNS